MRLKTSLLTLIFLATLLQTAVFADAAPLREGLQQATANTAPLLRNQTVAGTAFRVGPRHFLTQLPDPAAAAADELALLWQADPDAPQTLPLTLVRHDSATGMALLRAPHTFVSDLPVPELAPAAELLVSESLTLFSFPGQPLTDGDPASITADFQRITSLQRQGGELQFILLERPPAAESRGGPALSASGAMIGLRTGTAPALQAPGVIPSERVLAWLRQPVVSFVPTPLSETNVHQEARISGTLEWLFPPSDPFRVTLSLTRNGETETETLALQGVEEFSGTVTPIPPPEAGLPPDLSVRVSFQSGEIRGLVFNRQIQVGEASVSLREVASLIPGESTRVHRRPAGRLEGKMDEPPLQVHIHDSSGLTIQIPWQDGTEFVFTPLPFDLPEITYTLRIQSEEQTLYERSGTWEIIGQSPPTADRTFQAGSPAPADGAPGVIQLPSIISGLSLGAGGRYLMLYMPEIRRIARFDLTTLNITGYVNLSENDIIFAAGERHLVVYYPEANLFARYNLETLVRERTAANPFSSIEQLIMGNASPGKLLVLAGTQHSRPHVYDVRRMAERPLRTTQIGHTLGQNNQGAASADGRTYAVSRRGVSPSGMFIFHILHGQMHASYEHHSAGTLLPSQDGERIFTSHGGIFTRHLTQLLNQRQQTNPAFAESFLPSLDPAFFFSYPIQHHSQRNEIPHPIRIYSRHELTPLTSLPDRFEELPELQPRAGARQTSRTESIPLHDRMIFAPQLNLFLTIPPSDDRIIARNVNIRAILDTNGIDYFFVSSMPPSAKAGHLYEYTLEVASRADGVQFTLETGPPGLEISPQGVIQWRVPEDFQEEAVVLRVRNALGQELFHTLRIVSAE